MFFFFKQKTAYEMRISDWSSDVCSSDLYGEHDFPDRFAAAARAAFQGVEYLFPYAYEKEVLAAALPVSELIQVLHNMQPGVWDAGARGTACLPDRVGAFQADLGTAICLQRALGRPPPPPRARTCPEGAHPGPPP